MLPLQESGDVVVILVILPAAGVSPAGHALVENVAEVVSIWATIADYLDNLYLTEWMPYLSQWWCL